MATITLCMIAKNAQDTLAHAIDSVRPLVDHVIVGVDDRSTDDTKVLCYSLPIGVYTFYWSDSFSEARNLGIKAANTDWILVIDADEQLTDGGRRILAQVRKGVVPERAMGIELVQDNGMGKESWVWTSPRILRNVNNLHYQYRVHEQPRWDGVEPDRVAMGRPEESSWPHIIHTGYNVDPFSAQYRAKARSYRQLAEMDIEEAAEGDKPYVEFTLAKSNAFEAWHYAKSAAENPHFRPDYKLLATALEQSIRQGLQLPKLTQVPDYALQK